MCIQRQSSVCLCNSPATTELYTLSLHDALPILSGTTLAQAEVNTIRLRLLKIGAMVKVSVRRIGVSLSSAHPDRSEEHTSELQSQFHLVCRLLLEKKNLSKPLVFNHERARMLPH